MCFLILQRLCVEDKNHNKPAVEAGRKARKIIGNGAWKDTYMNVPYEVEAWWNEQAGLVFLQVEYEALDCV